MATVKETLALVIQADAKGAVRELERVGSSAKKNLGDAEKSTRNWSATFTAGGVAAVGFATVVGAGLLKAARSADEARLAQEKLDNSIANSPQLAGASKQAFLDLASALQKVTVADDEAVVGAEALLAQFGLTQDQILKVTPLVVDLSRKMGIGLDQAAKAVGKSVDGSAGALKRYGIVVDPAKEKTDAFGATVDALNRSVGGFARAEGKTFAGQLAIVKNELGEVAENLGAGVVPAFEALLGPLRAASSLFNDLSPEAQRTVGSFAGIGTAAVGATGGVAILVGQFSKLKSVALADPAAGLSGGLSGAGKAMVAAAGATVLFSAAMVNMAEKEREAQGRIDELTEAVRQSGRALDDVTGTVLSQFLRDNRDVVDVLEKSGVSQERYTEAITKGGDAYDDVLGSLKLYSVELVRAGEANGARNRATNLAIQQLQKERTAVRESSRALEDGRQLHENYAKTVKDRMLTTIDRIEGAFGRATAAVYRHRDAVLGVNDATRDAASALLDSEQAVIDARNAEAAYVEAVKAHGANSDEAKAADIARQRAILDVSQATDDAKRAVVDLAREQSGYDEKKSGTKGAAAFRDALAAVRDTLAPGSGLRAYLDAYIARLDSQDGRTVTTTFETVFVSRGTPENGRVVQHRAGGGPVKAHSPYVVGENGPELFVPSASGTIIPNGFTSPTPMRASMSTSAGASGDIYITINATGGNGRVVEKAVTQALVNAHRRGDRRKITRAA